MGGWDSQSTALSESFATIISAITVIILLKICAQVLNMISCSNSTKFFANCVEFGTPKKLLFMEPITETTQNKDMSKRDIVTKICYLDQQYYFL